MFRHFSEWGWEKLPDSYLTSPYLSLDNEAISSYINPEEQVSLTTDTEKGSVEQSELDDIPRKVLHVHMNAQNLYYGISVHIAQATHN